MKGITSIAIIATSLGISAVGIYYALKKSKTKSSPPKKWRRIGTLEEIYYFPIKSCGGIEVNSALCKTLGIQDGYFKDRMLVAIDGNNENVLASTNTKMVLIQPRVSGKQLIISAPGMKDLRIHHEDLGLGSTLEISVEGNNVVVVDCGDACSKWFSNFILGKDEGIRLAYYPHSTPTKLEDSSNSKNGIFLKNDMGALQNDCGYMLMNQTSINDLNNKLTNKVHHKQFRGNFVVKSIGEPYEEDSWKWIKIGRKTIFQVIAPCYRCIIPNINPFTGKRDPDCEPLKTLKSYRITEKSKDPAFGILLGLRNSGPVQKGDDIYVEDN